MSALELARFALYADLGLAFGVLAAAILTGAALALDRLKPFLMGALALGVPLAIAGYLLTVAEMAGVGLGDLDGQMVAELTTSSALGWAFVARIALLAIAVAIGAISPNRYHWAVLPAGAALCTLAWSGHAAASEGLLALPRLAADFAHLLAASAWLGALGLFLAMLPRQSVSRADCARALERFAGVGSVLVAVLVGTGLANLWFIAPPDAWAHLAATRYGRLLAAKLALLIFMLGLAALHRFVLVPRLARLEVDAEARLSMERRLLVSIGLECAAALAILGLVAKMGMLDPTASQDLAKVIARRT